MTDGHFMNNTVSGPESESERTPSQVRIPSKRWRVVDIAVASVIGVASAVIYWVVAMVTTIPWSFLDGVVPGLGGILNGLYLFAGPLASVIVRKPGAAVYAELVAAILESLLGSLWVPVETILIGLLQGFMAELVFMLMR